MIPLQLTDAALTATPGPSVPGLAQPPTGAPAQEAAFAAMFDLLVPRQDGDQPALIDAALPAAGDEVEAEIEQIALGAVHQAGPDTDAPDRPPPLRSDQRAEVPQAAEAGTEVARKAPPDTPAGPLTAPRSGAQATFAQTVLEGRLPPAPIVMPSQSPNVTEPAATPERTPKAGVVRDMPPPLINRAEDQVVRPGRSGAADTALPQRAPGTGVANNVPLPLVPMASDKVLKRTIPDGPVPPGAPELPRELGVARAATKVPAAAAETLARVMGEAKGQHREIPLPDVPPVQTGPTANSHGPALPTPAVTAPSVIPEEPGKNAMRAEPVAEVATGPGATERATTAPQFQTTSATAATAGAETARHVAGQIAVAISGQPGRPTEIALNPAELGRVRLSMTAVDQTITVNLLAERPETTDLLRRHIDALAQEFRALGYDNIAFSFGGDDTTAQGNADPDPDFDGGMPDSDIVATVDEATTAQPTGPETGLDLRL